MRSDRTNRIDKLLQSRLANRTAKTKESDWIAIMEDLEQIEGKGKKRRRLLFLGLLGFILVSVLSVGYLVINSQANKSKIADSNKTINNLEATESGEKAKIPLKDNFGKQTINSNDKIAENNYSNENAVDKVNNKASYKNNEALIDIKEENIANDNPFARENIENKIYDNEIETENIDKTISNKVSDDLAVSYDNEKRKDEINKIDPENNSEMITLQTALINLPLDSNVDDLNVDIKDKSRDYKDSILNTDTSNADSTNESDNNKTSQDIPEIWVDIINIKGAKVSFVISPAKIRRNSSIKSEALKQVHREYEARSKESERESYGYTLGLGFSYNFINHININTGLIYNSYTVNNEYDYSIGDIPVIDSKTNNIIAYIPRTETLSVISKSSNTYQYFEVPMNIGVSYKLGHKISLGIEFGMNLLKSIKANGSVISEKTLKLIDLESSDIIQLRPWNTEVNLSAGLLYQFNKNMVLAIEPEYRKQFTSIYSNNYPIQTKNSSIGISTTILLKLNKRK